MLIAVNWMKFQVTFKDHAMDKWYPEMEVF